MNAMILKNVLTDRNAQIFLDHSHANVKMVLLEMASFANVSEIVSLNIREMIFASLCLALFTYDYGQEQN